MRLLIIAFEFLLLSSTSYIWIALALLTKRVGAKVYEINYGSLTDTEYTSDSLSLTPSFNQYERIMNATITFTGEISDPTNFAMYMNFDYADTDKSTAYCYIFNDIGFGASSSSATLGNSTAPVTISNVGTVNTADGSNNFNTQVYGFTEKECFRGFRYD